MAAEETRRVVPRGDLQGSLGSGEKRWEKAYIGNVGNVYDTVADMIADLELREGSSVSTKGRLFVNDGGAALYKIHTKAVSDIEDGIFTIFLDNGNVAKKIVSEEQDIVRFLFPKTETKAEWQDPSIVRQGDCQIIVTPSGKTLMIDASTTYQYDYLMSYMQVKGITKIDYFVLTHYHGDHYGNIQNFLNQNIIDFSHTKWYLPVPVNADGGISLGALVKGWLDAANADYEYLNDDTTLQLDKTVSMFLFNCTDEARQYELDNLLVESGANAFSVQALIYHHDVVVYYTGDVWAQGIEWIVNNYDLPNVDLLKVNHHGLYVSRDLNYGGSISAYMRKICPKYSVYNMAEVGIDNAKNNLVDLTCQYGEVYQILDDAEFISDGKVLHKITDNHWRTNAISEEQNTLYVDCNYDFSNGISDGTINRPFRYFNEVKAYMGTGLSRTFRIFFAGGDYGDISLEGVSDFVQLEFSHDNDTYFNNISIIRCRNVEFIYYLNCKTLTIIDSNVKSPSHVAISPTSTSSKIENSNVHFIGNTIIDGTNHTITGNFILEIIHSKVYFSGLAISNDLGKTPLRINHGSNLSIGGLTLTNITATYVVRGFEGGASLYVSSNPIMTSCTFYAFGLKNEMQYMSTPALRTKIGTNDQAPNIKFIPFGFLYYNKTTNKLIMLSDSNTWIDVT